MSTSCLIARKVDDKIESIYCHWDGYPRGKGSVGQTLKDHYCDISKVADLMELGDLSCLGETPIADPNGWRSVDNDDLCVTYRSRGDTDVDKVVHDNMDAFVQHCKNSNVDFIYLFDNMTWKLMSGRSDKFVKF